MIRAARHRAGRTHGMIPTMTSGTSCLAQRIQRYQDSWGGRPAGQWDNDWGHAQPAGYAQAPAPPSQATAPQFWPMPKPRHDQPDGAFTPSECIRTETRYVWAKDGTIRPVFRHSNGNVCCGIACQISSCDYGRPPCGKRVHDPLKEDVHEVHRCSKCKEAGK